MRVGDKGTQPLPAVWKSQWLLSTSRHPDYTSTSQCCAAMRAVLHSGEHSLELPQSHTLLEMLGKSYLRRTQNEFND